MPKERGANPVAEQRKADKRKEIAKSKKNVQGQRNEKLARRNPDRLQKQIDELKELEARGPLRPKEKEHLAQLERDLRGVKRAREALGDAAPKFPSHEQRRERDPRQEQRDRRQHLGKRRRNDEEAQSSDTDPEVTDIPMPRDTPPPIPREQFKDSQIGPDGQRMPHALPSKPAVAAPPPQLVYSSAPVLRDLKKEATKFVPAAVRQKLKQAKGQGKLLEAEELDKLEQAGYFAAPKSAERQRDGAEAEAQAQVDVDVDVEEQLKMLDAEMKQVGHEDEQVRGVHVEEVEDDGD